MSKRQGPRGLLAVGLSALLMLLAVGCNEIDDFNPDELFSIEDYATDQDYAIVFVDMMNQWRGSLGNAKQELDVNVEGLTFTESIPAGWTANNPSLRTYPWSVVFVVGDDGELLPASDADQFLGGDWYFRSFQDASYEFIRLDKGVGTDATLQPAKIEYMQLQFLSTPFGSSVGVGDSVAVWHTSNFANPSRLDGAARFWSNELVTAQQSPSDIAAYATMTNIWSAEISNLSPDPQNPQAEFDIDGQTLLTRADLVEQSTLPVQIDASLRSNGRGSASITVDGEELARVVIEYYDTAFHGYYELRESGFREPIRF